MYTSPSPTRTALATAVIACSDEAQNRWTVCPGTDSGNPARMPAVRATLKPVSPACATLPHTMSCTCSRGTSGTPSISAARTSAISSSARFPTSEPLLARPIGLRVAATTTGSSGLGARVSGMVAVPFVGDQQQRGRGTTGRQPERDVRRS
jgi:hypothetical protein